MVSNTFAKFCKQAEASGMEFQVIKHAFSEHFVTTMYTYVTTIAPMSEGALRLYETGL